MGIYTKVYIVTYAVIVIKIKAQCSLRKEIVYRESPEREGYWGVKCFKSQTKNPIPVIEMSALCNCTNYAGRVVLELVRVFCVR